MSLEQKIETLTAAVAALTQTLQSQQQVSVQSGYRTAEQNQAAAMPPVQQPAAPQFAQQAVPAAPAPQMPPPPNFMAPPAAPAPQGAPFTDAKGLIEYATQAYGALGAEKGAGMQTIISQMGVTNINDIKPEQYGAFYAAVEALKVQ